MSESCAFRIRAHDQIARDPGSTNPRSLGVLNLELVLEGSCSKEIFSKNRMGLFIKDNFTSLFGDTRLPGTHLTSGPLPAQAWLRKFCVSEGLSFVLKTKMSNLNDNQSPKGQLTLFPDVHCKGYHTAQDSCGSLIAKVCVANVTY